MSPARYSDAADETGIRRLADELFITTDLKAWAAARALFADGPIEVDTSSLVGAGPLPSSGRMAMPGTACRRCRRAATMPDRARMPARRNRSSRTAAEAIMPSLDIDAEISSWPPLPYEEWKDTQATLHLWTQIVGKIRLAQTPWTNHSWHVALYVTSRGLTTSPIPYGTRSFEIVFDFLDHALRIQTGEGAVESVELAPRTVADFYHEVFERLGALGLDISIRTLPCEIPNAIPFDRDRDHGTYDAEHATRFWRALVQADRVLKTFRSRFVGKSSPVHFFWGSFDLAVTRFSGRRAPAHPGGVPNLPDWVVREAYSHEVSSCGFWPGGEMMPEPVFYAYAYPEPEGFRAEPVRPAAAHYDAALGEFLLPYDHVRRATSPDATLLEFLQSSYEAAAERGAWDRPALERHPER